MKKFNQDGYNLAVQNDLKYLRDKIYFLNSGIIFLMFTNIVYLTMLALKIAGII